MLKHKGLLIAGILLAFLCIVFGGILLMIGAVLDRIPMLYAAFILLGTGLLADFGFLVYLIVYFVRRNR